MNAQLPSDGRAMSSMPNAMRRQLLKGSVAATAATGLQALASPNALSAEPVHAGHQMSEPMQAAIKACLDCHSNCLQTAMNFCLEQGGRHVGPAHLRLILNCAELCQTSANFMLSNSSMHGRVCGVCAEACEACARSCEEVGGMSECKEECLRCAKSCRSMAS